MVKDELIAQEFTPVYDAKEDRIRLIVNIHYPTRYDFYLTRKLLIKLLERFSDLLKENLSTTTIQRAAISPQTDIAQSEKKVYPPTNKQIFLIEKINIQFDKKNKKYTITISDNNKSVISSLTANELKNLLKLLSDKVKFEWGLNF